MYKIFCILILFGFFSCKSTTAAQEIQDLIGKDKKIDKPKFTDIEDQSEDPGSMKLIASIVSMDKDANLCDRKYILASKLKIKEVIRTGRFISRPLEANQEIVMGFMNVLTKTKTLQKEISIGQEISIIVRERMCIDQSQRTYEIIDIKIEE